MPKIFRLPYHRLMDLSTSVKCGLTVLKIMVFDNLVGVSYKGLPGKKDMRSLKSL